MNPRTNFRPSVQSLEDRRYMAADVGVEAPSDAKVDSQPTEVRVEESRVEGFTPFGGFTGGVYVASGDINGDGFADIITGAGAGGGPHVRVFDGTTNSTDAIDSFFAYEGFSGGVRVAVGDVNGDGTPDIITGAGPGGGPHVKVFNGNTGLQQESADGFFAYDAGFRGGVRVAVGDVNGDGTEDIVVAADAGGGPHVRVIHATDVDSFFAYDPAFTGGVFVASGD